MYTAQMSEHSRHFSVEIDCGWRENAPDLAARALAHLLAEHPFPPGLSLQAERRSTTWGQATDEPYTVETIFLRGRYSLAESEALQWLDQALEPLEARAISVRGLSRVPLSCPCLSVRLASRLSMRLRDGLGQPLDPAMRRPVAGLLRWGVETQSSCAGHLKRGLPHPWIMVAKTSQARVEDLLSRAPCSLYLHEAGPDAFLLLPEERSLRGRAEFRALADEALRAASRPDPGGQPPSLRRLLRLMGED